MKDYTNKWINKDGNKGYYPTKLFNVKNAKTIKGEKLGYLTAILYLSPYKESGFNMCPKASKGCIKACLYNSGHAKMYDSVNLGRMNKTKYFMHDRKRFITQLNKEIENLYIKATSNNMKLCIRFNGTSDFPIETLGIMQKWNNIQWYDYTKIPKRMYQYLDGKLPPNYHLTFSRTEDKDNHEHCKTILDKGGNVAMVFRKAEKYINKTYYNYFPIFFNKVIDGDMHDLRFLDRKNSIVGLSVKPNEYTKESNGFIIEGI